MVVNIVFMFCWQDQYVSISDHTQKGIDFCEKFAHFVKERCQIENEYASKLRSAVSCELCEDYGLLTVNMQLALICYSDHHTMHQLLSNCDQSS